MTDLRSFAVLQARVYEFLERQDEDTLRSIVDGTAQLAVAGAAEHAPPADRAPRPSNDPFQVVQDLARLASAEDRRSYLRAARLKKKDLDEVARRLGMRGFSKLRVSELIDVLAGSDDTGEPKPPAPARAPRAPARARQAPARAPQAPAEARPPAAPTAEVTAIATKLRETETEEEGAEYLTEQQLARDDLLAVAAELGLTRVNRLPQTELEKRVLKQAIGARRKFAGLRRW